MRAGARLVLAALPPVILACAHASKPTPTSTPPDCGDIPDFDDACPLVDGCEPTSSEPGEDGCPAGGAIPAATTCEGDGRRLAEIAAKIGQRPKLTKLRIVSSVPGCAAKVQDGLVRAGVPAAKLDAVTRGQDSGCTRWAHFEIASWDARRCSDGPGELQLQASR